MGAEINRRPVKSQRDLLGNGACPIVADRQEKIKEAGHYSGLFYNTL